MKLIEVSDLDYIGVNVLGLYTIPHFLELFLAVPLSDELPPVYFKEQVEKLYYDKKNLFEIIREQKGDSFLMSLIHVTFSQGEEEKKLFYSQFPE